MQELFFTTSIPYVNGRPHIGHALEYIQADTLARFEKLRGNPVFLATGADEHGQKNARAAEKSGVTPKEHVNKTSALFKDMINQLNVEVDTFTRTTGDTHKAVCQWLWRQADAAGDLYKKSYTGLYCTGCEEYKQPGELVNGNCPVHGTPPEEQSEENWFFKLSKYRQPLRQAIERGDITILPTHRTKETLNFLDKAEDISVSRPKSKLTWGIDVPGDPGHVMYVWFDALTNYLTASRADLDKLTVERADFVRWPADLHIVGKDIFRFHTIIWPAMLLSANLPIPRQVLIHGFVNNRGEKMSKSSGNVVDPVPYIEKYGADALRYFLLRHIPTTDDGDFSDERFATVYDKELVNNLGNLVQRTLVLMEKNSIPISARHSEAASAAEESRDESGSEANGILRASGAQDDDSRSNLPDWYTEAFEKRDLAAALNGVMGEVEAANRQIDEAKPWITVKTDPAAATQALQSVHKYLQQIAYLLTPFLPVTAERLSDQLSTLKPAPLFPRMS